MPTLSWMSPGWLWGLGALAVPVVIHLLSRGTARRVAVGSVVLIVAGSSHRARRIRFTDGWLAALRALLLLWLVLALAEPRWRPAARAEVWGLTEPDVMVALQQDPARAPEAAERLRSLAATQELRLLAAGLPHVVPGAKSELEGPHGRGEGLGSPATPGGIWSMLREAAATAPPGTRFEVFSHGAVEAFVGQRPALANEVAWHIVPPPAEMWVARATGLDEGTRQWVARSGAVATTITPTMGSASEDSAALPEEASAWMAELAAAAPLRVRVYTEPERRGDGDDVVAALNAIERVGWLSLDVTRTALEATPEGQPPRDEAASTLGLPDADVVIWLAARPVADRWRDWLAAGGLLLQDARSARYRDCQGHADLPGDLGTVVFRRCAEVATVPEDDLIPVWRDRQGRPLLSATPDGRTWTLASRFHPRWSDLVRSPAFPHWLAQWLDRSARQTGRVVARPGIDRRQASSVDYPVAALRPVPEERSSDSGASDPPIQARLATTHALAPWLWSLLGLTLVTERWWARRRTV